MINNRRAILEELAKRKLLKSQNRKFGLQRNKIPLHIQSQLKTALIQKRMVSRV